jgi:hypothetical protein
LGTVKGTRWILYNIKDTPMDTPSFSLFIFAKTRHIKYLGTLGQEACS